MIEAYDTPHCCQARRRAPSPIEEIPPLDDDDDEQGLIDLTGLAEDESSSVGFALTEDQGQDQDQDCFKGYSSDDDGDDFDGSDDDSGSEDKDKNQDNTIGREECGENTSEFLNQ